MCPSSSPNSGPAVKTSGSPVYDSIYALEMSVPINSRLFSSPAKQIRRIDWSDTTPEYTDSIGGGTSGRAVQANPTSENWFPKETL